MMYLNPVLQKKLDAPVKAFEVALRSYVVDRLLQVYPTAELLKVELERRINAVKDTDIILSGKVTSAKKLLGNSKWNTFWDNLTFIHSCYQKEEHNESHDVTDLNDTILIIYIFQNLYEDLTLSFERIEDCIFYLSKYHSVRNSLSHRGSYQISNFDAQDCVEFMIKTGNNLDSGYFWYRPFETIQSEIDEFSKLLLGRTSMLDNLDRVPFPTNCIVCREPELQKLFTFVCGWDGERRLRNKKHLVCVSGYGGIGKTSLVTEFVSRLLDSMASDSYLGLRPTFILFYSAKIQVLDFDRTTGALFSKKVRSQFSNFSELWSCISHDLNVNEFSEDWKREGIIIIDNLETLNHEEREKVIDFINYDLPTTIQVIITTRIPEHADELIQLRGFQNDSGLTFIQEYLSENHIELTLNQDQCRELIKFSYGNSLVLVLALKRLYEGKVSFRAIINEMRRLPKNNADNSISHFMFQNTIEDLFKNYPQHRELIKSVLICLSIRQEALTADVLASAHRRVSVTIDDIEEVLQVLANYLVVEKYGDHYAINEFANHFILIGMFPSPEIKRQWESDLLTAIHDNERQKMTVTEFKDNYPELAGVLSEWKGEHCEESLAICNSFALYDNKKRITRGNKDFEIDMLNRQFDQIEHIYSAHPYTYYQRARILKELRQEEIIEDEYNDLIKSNYERCLMMIDTPAFSQIKSTKTYPSVLWIFSQFLLSINLLNEAARYAYLSVQNFDRLAIFSGDRADALVVYGIAEVKLFALDWDVAHLKIARNVQKDLQNAKSKNKLYQGHIELLTSELLKYRHFKT